MRRPVASALRSGHGQSLAEFALILPVLMIIVLGTVDLGRVFFAYISVTNAARNGAQYAASDSENVADVTGIRDAALADTGQLLNTSAANPDVAIATGDDSQGHLYAEVTVSYDFSTLFPWPGLPDSVNVQRKVRAMVSE